MRFNNFQRNAQEKRCLIGQPVLSCRFVYLSVYLVIPSYVVCCTRRGVGVTEAHLIRLHNLVYTDTDCLSGCVSFSAEQRLASGLEGMQEDSGWSRGWWMMDDGGKGSRARNWKPIKTIRNTYSHAFIHYL